MGNPILNKLMQLAYAPYKGHAEHLDLENAKELLSIIEQRCPEYLEEVRGIMLPEIERLENEQTEYLRSFLHQTLREAGSRGATT